MFLCSNVSRSLLFHVGGVVVVVVVIDDAREANFVLKRPRSSDKLLIDKEGNNAYKRLRWADAVARVGGKTRPKHINQKKNIFNQNELQNEREYDR